MKYLINFITGFLGALLSIIAAIGFVVLFGVVAGFWFKFAHLGFTMATQLMNNFL